MTYINRMLKKPVSVFVRGAVLLIPVVCIVLLLTLTAFAKNTYYINDGGRVLVHTTYATDPAEILNEAGVELDSGDKYTTQSVIGASEITVQRRQTITVITPGLSRTVYSYGETVENLIHRLGMELRPNDVLSLPLSTQTYSGMVLSIQQGALMEESYAVAIPFETVYCQDPSLPEGQEVVLIPGVEGELIRTDSVYYLNGEEQSRTEISSQITRQSVDALIAIGTKVDQPAQSGTFIDADGKELRYLKKLTVKATAYSKYDPGCNDYTAAGTLARYGVVAVDPKLIPLGSKLYIMTSDGQFIYGHASAEDTGGSIKGNRIDLCFDTTQQCNIFGRRECTVYVLSEG